MHIIQQILNATKTKILNYLNKYSEYNLHLYLNFFIIIILILFIFNYFDIVLIMKIIQVFFVFILLLFFFILLLFIPSPGLDPIFFFLLYFD